MKVAIISRAENVSGKEIMTLELGEGLRSAGHEVSYVTSFWNDGHYQERLERLGFSHRSLALGAISATLRPDCIGRTLRQLSLLPSLWKDYREFLKDEGTEQAIHTSWHHLILLWPYLNPSRDWYWVHEVLPDKPRYRRFFQRLAKKLKGFIPVSEAVGDALAALGVPREKIHVIHNGLRDLATSPKPQAPNGTATRIGIVGQVAEWKGHHLLLEAFARVHPGHPTAELHIYGMGPSAYEERIRSQARLLGVQGQLHWHGYVNDRSSIYKNLDLCVVPVPLGANEALPTVAIEAGFFQIPVIASRTGGLIEILKDGETGLLIQPGDVDELSEQLGYLIDNLQLRHAMGVAARMRICQCFTRERFVDDFNQLIARAQLVTHSSADQPVS